jgi:hypothetical protein
MKGETMNHTPDTTTAGNGGSFDPQQAAALLDQTTQQARRTFAPSPPWLLAARGAGVLAALGAIWLSVRGQHPYKGPTSGDIPILVAFIVLNFAATVTVRGRALAGVQGSTRLRPAEIIVLVASFAAAVAGMAALAANGVSFAWYPTTVLFVPGLAWAAIMGLREGWRGSVMGLAIAAIGVVGAFAGSAGSWLVAGVGLCVVLLGRAVAVAWGQHRSVGRP